MKTLKNDFPIYLMLFILIQPILDLSTYLSMRFFDIGITPGIIVRVLVLAFSILYLITRRSTFFSKAQFIYLSSLFVFSTVHFGNNLIVKDSFSLVTELTALIKSLYFVIMFFVFIVVFKELFKRDKTSLFPKNVALAVLIINVIMTLATVTGTGKRSYGALYKIGHSGWFYAANDIGVILALALPIVVWFTYIKQGRKWIAFNWINTLLTLVSLFTIGTKVGHIAVVIVLGLAVFAIGFDTFIKKAKREDNIVHLSISAFLLLVTLVLTPYLPAYTNSTGQIAYLREMNEATEEVIEDDTEDVRLDQDFEQDSSEEDFFGESNTRDSEIVEGVIYSGRSGFLELHQEYFNEAPLSQKTFGMGHAGNYEGAPKLIERDFHDLFFQFGIFGFVLYMLPFIYYGFKVLVSFWKKLSDIFMIKYMMLLSSVALGLGIGFLAGHTLMSPAVSIYLSVVLAYLVEDRSKHKGEYINE